MDEPDAAQTIQVFSPDLQALVPGTWRFTHRKEIRCRWTSPCCRTFGRRHQGRYSDLDQYRNGGIVIRWRTNWWRNGETKWEENHDKRGQGSDACCRRLRPQHADASNTSAPIPAERLKPRR